MNRLHRMASRLTSNEHYLCAFDQATFDRLHLAITQPWKAALMVVFVVIATLVASVISLLGPLLFGKILALSLVGADTTGIIVYDGKAGQQSSFRARTYEFATTDGSKRQGAIAQKFPKSIGDRTQVRYLPALPSLNMEIAPTSGSSSLPVRVVAHSFLILIVSLFSAFAMALIVLMANMTWRSCVFFGKLVRAEQPAP